ncbi:outer membrane beta-barrel protein [Zunongwangia sp. F363]|uniref:Outer membrane beta-barrel protein n=1 Tax=Autumnicola tepida TaxID=3075595 RepID=A0ABU3C7M3_9FLAO|nr:outer membrane beta-barrel protein [Zunongwangia sp. F363]MDT0642192.1 outer membrane beta-barrel protein [Zunongwangia sp. F363]
MKFNYRNTYRSKINIKLLLLVLVCSAMGNSYGQSKSEVSFYLKGSFSKLDYEVLQDKSDLENGFGFGAQYAYYLSENWSIGTGAGLQYMEGAASLSSVEGAYATADPEGEAFEFRYRVEDFRENQYAYFLNVPLKVQFETGDIARFYAAAGAKMGFVLQSEYETEASSLTTSGYYEQYDAELREPMFAGFGDFGALKTSRSDLGLQTNLILNLETGVKFMLENDQALYMGVFVDYGLKNIKPEKDGLNLIAYNAEDPMSFTNNSLLTSASNTASTAYVDEVKTLAFGMKIRYGFRF